MAQAPGTFGDVLRELRVRAGLTQQELAAAAGLGLRTVSDLERGVAALPQQETGRRLAGALGLTGAERGRFDAAARGRALAEGPAAAAAAMRSLPRDVASFTGRARELAELAKSAMTAGGVVSIHAIGGMAGVGKTAFAVHAAHQLAGRFPGGQVFLQLHGHTPGRAPVDPADALASLLLVTGVPPGQVPAGLEARAALWRDRAGGQQVLLVLDDAVSSEQVEPLLPGASGSLVLVTSRRHLSALDDATAVSLDTLPPGEAAALLVRLAGRPGLGASDPAVAELTRLCGFLPLAVGMVARQLRHHPAWSAAGRAGELAAARDRLGLMETENLSVAAAFDLSYADLGGDQQRLFRRLGLHPGADIDGYAAAALDGTSLPVAHRGLEALYDQYLLAEPARGRYRLHDLIREHARALAGRADPGEDRDAAMTRLLDYYQHASAAADARIRGRVRPGPAAGGGVPTPVLVLADTEEALAWARAERASLLACLDHAAGAGEHARVIALTTGISTLLERDGPWADAVARHTAAIRAAQHLGDRLSRANALSDLGNARRLTGNYPAAVLALEESLGICRDLGDQPGQASALTGLGDAWRMTGDYPAAARVLEEALRICGDLGDRPGQARILTRMGTVLWMTSDYPAAARVLEEALGICRDLGDRLGQASALTGLGDAWRMTGDYPAAARVLEEALGICCDLGDRLGRADALTRLGAVLWQMADYPAAARVLEEALGICRVLGDRHGQANTLNLLGVVRQQTGDYPAAGRALEEALGICRDLGDRLGQANALNLLGAARQQTGNYLAAAQAHEEALRIYRDLGNRLGQARALTRLGTALQMMGDYPAAARALDEALVIGRDAGIRGMEVMALNERGAVHRVSGEIALAEGCHRQALELARQIGNPQGEAHALAGLGRCALAAGQAAEAGSLLRQALEIFLRIGAAEALGLAADLDALTDPRPGQ
jgi:tetratricopeptide (TPR) repeat protein/transcriptional regulator with XRE-family HTH domain